LKVESTIPSLSNLFEETSEFSLKFFLFSKNRLFIVHSTSEVYELGPNSTIELTLFLPEV